MRHANTIIEPWFNGDPCEGCQDCEKVCVKLQTRIDAALQAKNASIDRMASLAIDNARAASRLHDALNNLLNDCINHDGGKLTEGYMVDASKALADFIVFAKR